MSETQASLIGKARMANARAAKNEAQTERALKDAERKWQRAHEQETRLRAIRGELQTIAAKLGKLLDDLDEQAA